MAGTLAHFRNSGEFHFGITPERLRTPHASRPWNPIIASVLHRAGVIERWGSGALNIIDWCREGGTPDPVWSEDARRVSATFFPAPAAAEGPARKRRPGSGKGSGRSSEKILACLRSNPTAMIAELAAALGISRRAVEKQLRKLREAGRLPKVGPDKGGHWQVVEGQ